jgi:hypothetical protein
MPLFLPDPTYAAIQTNPRRQRGRGWAFAGVAPAAPDVYDGGSPSSTGTDIYDFGSPSSTGTDIYDGGTP